MFRARRELILKPRQASIRILILDQNHISFDNALKGKM